MNTKSKTGRKFAAAVVAAMAVAGVAGAAPIAKDGKPVAAVRTENASHDLIVYAAQELTNWVCRISGAALPVDPAAGDFKTKIVLGTPETSPAVKAFAAKHADDFRRLDGNDGFIIAEEGGFLGFGAKTVYVVGSVPRGVRNGVYRFLERNSDIIWARQMHGEDGGFGTVWTPDPDMENGIDYLCDVPTLLGRSWTAVGDEQGRWQARLLNNGIRGAKGVGFSLCLLDKYKDKAEDLDVFPLDEKGKRLTYPDHQLCFMNPKTVRLFVEEAKAVLAKKTKEEREGAIVGCGLGDNWGVCHCKEWCSSPIDCGNDVVCRPSDRNFRSTQYAHFVMSVYEALKRDYPELKPPKAFAYIFTADPPSIRYPSGGGMYCPYVKNHKKPVYDDLANRQWHERAESFRKAGMAFTGLYEYYLCWTTPRFYHATMDVMKLDLNYYLPELRYCYLDVMYNDNILAEKDYAKESDQGWGGFLTDNWIYDVSGVEFWVCSRLMWNAQTDVTEARHEYCRRAYHGAADIMIGYYDRLAANYNADPAGCFWNDDPVAAAKYYLLEKGLGGWARETLAKAEKAATDPRSKALIARHARRINSLLDKAEKTPKRVTLVVPQIIDEKPSSDPDAPFWKLAAEVAPLTAISAATPEPKHRKTAFRIAHDRKNLYLLMTTRSENDLKKLRAVRDAYGKPWDAGAPYQWDCPFELYLDGDLGKSGGYYMFSAMWTGRTWASRGTTYDATVKWTVDLEELKTHDGIAAFVTWPLDQIGVDISKGNKLGAMFLSNTAAWNGGQWHAPTSFQTLMLEMK